MRAIEMRAANRATRPPARSSRPRWPGHRRPTQPRPCPRKWRRPLPPPGDQCASTSEVFRHLDGGRRTFHAHGEGVGRGVHDSDPSSGIESISPVRSRTGRAPSSAASARDAPLLRGLQRRVRLLRPSSLVVVIDLQDGADRAEREKGEHEDGSGAGGGSIQRPRSAMSTGARTRSKPPLERQMASWRSRFAAASILCPRRPVLERVTAPTTAAREPVHKLA